MNKIIQTREVAFIEFDEDEMKELGIAVRDKFTVEKVDGSLTLKKHESIEVDLSDYTKEQLMNIIDTMNSNDWTFEELVTQSLQSIIKKD